MPFSAFLGCSGLSSREVVLGVISLAAVACSAPSTKVYIKGETIMTDHSSNFTDESRAKTARTRAAATAGKAKSRARQAEREKVKALDGLEAEEARSQLWQTNREALTADQRLDLESRQDRFAGICGSVLTAIEDLKLGKTPGVNTYFVDALFEEIRDYRKETQP